MNTVKSDFVTSEDAAATRVELDKPGESDFSTSDPSGNQRDPLNQMKVCQYEEFAGGAWMRANREASTPRDHKGVPAIQEVSEKDERTSKGGY